MKLMIEQYIEGMKLTWKPSTIKSEKARLNAVADVLDGDPKALWGYLERNGVAPYTRVTIWTRVCKFWNWYLRHEAKSGTNTYNEFRAQNPQLFRGTYCEKFPDIDFAAARERIARIEDSAIRNKALELLQSGLRYTESFTYQNGIVVGKGGRPRRAYLANRKEQYTGTYKKFWEALGRVGLKPHDLRKLAASKLVEEGATEFDLCKIMGWSSINTAGKYVRVREDRIRQLMGRLQK